MLYKETITMNKSLVQIIESWATTENPMNSTDELLEWITKKNKEIKVQVEKIPFSDEGFWYYDKHEGGIINRNNSFFKIKGLIKQTDSNIVEQPIIIQDEIGYLGIIGKVIDGVLYFLMQAKIEPGNVNKVQISPTIQATKSNFMQSHGGKVPSYLEYFASKANYEIVVDQIQSEQSSRFYKKRNRNIIIIVDDDIEVYDTHRWMTIGQIKELMNYDNIVNMDTRTVISCIPFSLRNFTYKELTYINSLFDRDSLFNSMFLGDGENHINRIYQYINEIKMLDKSKVSIVDLNSLNKWKLIDDSYQGDGEFKVSYFDIRIEGREVECWQQPLLETMGKSTFGLIYYQENGMMKFLVQTVTEVGCFDKIEIGPSVQIGLKYNNHYNKVTEVFLENIKNKQGIEFYGLFSEEGGRFYHEQNVNVIMKISKDELDELPEGYFWADFYTLNTFIQFNNCLNIQLRNLLSILHL